MPAKNWVGQRVGSLVVERLYRERRESGEGWRYLADMRCDCGGLRVVERGNLSAKKFDARCSICSGNKGGKISHGNSISRKELDPIGYKCYYTWQAMKRRCGNPSDKRYSRYGGRGISVCQQWLDSYEQFKMDMGLPPSTDHQIDRIDNNGNYCPENCRWVSRTENARNKSNNHTLTAFGETLTLSEWSTKTGLTRESIAARLNRGYVPEDALKKQDFRVSGKVYVTELGSFASIQEAADAHKMSLSGAYGRFKSDNYPEWFIKHQ